MSVVVLDMNDRRPVWAMPDRVPERIRSALPEGWSLRVVQEATDGSGDGAGRVSPAVRRSSSPRLRQETSTFWQSFPTSPSGLCRMYPRPRSLE